MSEFASLIGLVVSLIVFILFVGMFIRLGAIRDTLQQIEKRLNPVVPVITPGRGEGKTVARPKGSVGTMQCPVCSEWIYSKAAVCRHCGVEFTD